MLTHVYEEAVNDLDECSSDEGSIRSVSLSIRGDEDEEALASPEPDDEPMQEERSMPAKARDGFLGAQELGELLGKPPNFGQKVEDFLSPEMQEAPKPRGRRKTAKKGKKRGCKRTKTTAKADEEPKHKRAKTAKPVEDDVPASKRSRRKPKASPKPKPVPKKACKAAAKAKAKEKSKAKCKAAATAGPKTTGAKAKAEAKPYRSPCLDAPDYKAKQSRKSSAYHRALKEAKAEGKTIPECRELARAAASLS